MERIARGLTMKVTRTNHNYEDMMVYIGTINDKGVYAHCNDSIGKKTGLSKRTVFIYLVLYYSPDSKQSEQLKQLKQSNSKFYDTLMSYGMENTFAKVEMVHLHTLSEATLWSIGGSARNRQPISPRWLEAFPTTELPLQRHPLCQNSIAGQTELQVGAQPFLPC